VLGVLIPSLTAIARISDKINTCGFPSNSQLNTRWRLPTKSIPITERKTAIARSGHRARILTCDTNNKRK